MAQGHHQGVDGGPLLGAEHVAIRIQCALRGNHHAVGVHTGLDHGTGLHVLRCRGKAVLQHPRDLVVREAVRWFHVNARLHPTALLLGGHAQQAIGIDGKGHTDARSACRHGGDTAQLKARQAAAVLHQVTLALHHMDGQGSLSVLVGGEVLRLGGGDGLVARDDALHQAAHGLDAQRQRNHIQQQQVTCGVVTCQLVGLDGGAQGHHFVRVQIGQRLLAEELCHGPLHLRHAGGAAHHDHALHLVARQMRIAQGTAHSRHGAGGQIGGHGIKIRAFDVKLHGSAR